MMAGMTRESGEVPDGEVDACVFLELDQLVRG